VLACDYCKALKAEVAKQAHSTFDTVRRTMAETSMQYCGGINMESSPETGHGKTGNSVKNS